MMLAQQFDEPPRNLFEMRPDRIFYGSDFPNLPYEWNRELACVDRAGLDRELLEGILNGTARRFFGIAVSP
jgi:predicted TIM-barrel fold metal-dependent hydrolase